jgi:chromosome segregation ATPase
VPDRQQCRIHRVLQGKADAQHHESAAQSSTVSEGSLFVVSIEDTAEFRKALVNAQHSITDKLAKKQERQVELNKEECRQKLLEEFKQQIQTLSDKVETAEQEIVAEKTKVTKMSKDMQELTKENDSLLEENKKMTSELEEIEEQRRGKIHLINELKKRRSNLLNTV